MLPRDVPLAKLKDAYFFFAFTAGFFAGAALTTGFFAAGLLAAAAALAMIISLPITSKYSA
jgi:hypothetical protein